MRQAALSIAMATVLLASAGLESKAQGTGNAEAKQAQTTQPPTGTVELAQDPSPRGSIIITLLSKLKEFINLSFPRPGAKMPRADVGQFSHFPRVDVASFGLTCSPADLVGHWERDPSDLLGYTGQSERSWIEIGRAHV